MTNLLGVVQIQLLGGVDATSDAGEPIDIGPAKCQAVLASLALSPGEAVPIARIVELVWGLEPPRTAEKTLQSYITRLRKSLGHESIERTGFAYRLAVEADSVDVSRFQQHVRAGNLDGALTEWTGTPLAGIDAPGLTGIIDGLVEQWLGTMELDLERRVEQDPATSIAMLTELTVQHPFREGLWALLMTALYRTDRQADALAAYQRARDYLVTELGVEPGPRLRELETLILGQDQQLTAVANVGLPVPTGTVTFGFTDIEGASELWAEHRQQMSAAVRRHDGLVNTSVAVHNGHVFSTGGDSFGVAFHRAGDAAAWAEDIQAAIAVEPWPGHQALRMRIGLHTGEAEERSNDYFGPAVNTTARLAGVGHGGQTLVSHLTASLLRGAELHDLGHVRFDDVGHELQIFQLGPGDHPPLRTDETKQGNLPRRAEQLFGRDEDLEAVKRYVDSQPVVTLVGAGGIGKTSLALAAARLVERDFPDGTWLVELSDVASSSEVVRSLADVLDLRIGAGATMIESIAARLLDLQALIVLDNCEHVVDGAAEVAALLRESCPRVKLLATSREGLGVAGEQLVAVGPLDPNGPAVELFAARARALDPSFDIESDRETVTEICRQLDGVPLAIELAAARIRSLAPVDLVARLDDHLRLLTGGRRRSVARHRTLRATAQWSHELLTPAEKILFRRLSIFSGSFDIAMTEAATSDEQLPVADVNALLGQLVDRSMVEVSSGSWGREFRLLETMRQFAAELLIHADEGETFARRHATFVGDEVARLGRLLMSNDEIEGASRLAALWPNVRAAIDWAFTVEDRDLVADLLRPIALQMFVRRGLGEISDWAERLLAVTPVDDTDTAAWCLLWASMHYSMTQRRDEFCELIDSSAAQDHLFVRYAYLFAVEDADFSALELGPQIIEEMRETGNPEYARLFEVFTAAALVSAGRFDEARAKHEELAAQLRVDGPPSFLNWCLYLLGASLAFQGDHEQADRYWDECATIEVPPRTNSPNELLSARAAFRRGQLRQAYRITSSYIDELVEADNMAGVALVCIDFVNMMTSVGRLHEAGVVLGHLDATGLLSVEGPGFKLLVADSIELVAADDQASAARTEAASSELDEHGALAYMRDAFDGLLNAEL